VFPDPAGGRLAFSDDGEVVTLDPGLAAELLYGDAPEQIATAAVGRLRPVRRAVFRGVPEQIGWRHRPSTYVVCADDLMVHPDLERAMAERQPPGRNGPAGTAR